MIDQKLSSIILIDDNETDNFYNKRIIQSADLTKNVAVFTNAEEALHKISAVDDQGKCLSPDLIFLDINMPGMNGWEFIDAYKRLERKVKKPVLIVMLTTSLNPRDWERARESNIVSGFHTKPLTLDTLNKIVLNSM